MSSAADEGFAVEAVGVGVGYEGLSEVCAVTGAFVGGEVVLARLQKPVKSHEVAHSGERFFKVVPGVIEKALLERVLFTAKESSKPGIEQDRSLIQTVVIRFSVILMFRPSVETYRGPRKRLVEKKAGRAAESDAQCCDTQP